MNRQSFFYLLLLSSSIATTKMPAPKKEAPPKRVSQKEYDQALYDWTQTLAEVLQLTSQKYYQLHEPGECMSKAIDAFLTNLDPHSSFLPPDKYKKILQATSGEFYGVGIVIDNTRKTTDKFLTIVEVLPSGPAAQAEVQDGDKIIAIGDKPVEGMSTDEAISHLKGEKKTTCEVKIVRDGASDMLSLSITRDIVKEQHSHAFYNKETNTYYLSLTQFSENAIKQIRDLLEKENDVPYKGLILDLRNNSGGLLHAAVDIASLFLDKGSPVAATKDRTGSTLATYTTQSDPIAKNDVPIIILINNYTASAAEILAGALKQYSQQADASAQKSGTAQKKLMVFLVGTKTFGKGSVQDVVPISNNSAVKLTTALYYLPDDTTVQGQGIEPDFHVERCFPPPEQLNWLITYFGREENFTNHIKPESQHKTDLPQKPAHKKQKAKTVKPFAQQAAEQLQKDSQFRFALTITNLLDTAKTTCPHQVNTRSKALSFLQKNCISQQKLSLKEVTTNISP